MGPYSVDCGLALFNQINSPIIMTVAGKFYSGLTLFLLFIVPSQTNAQEKEQPKAKTHYKVRGFLNGGYEHNLFYAPTSLRRSNGTMVSKDSLINSGAFGLSGASFLLTRKKGKKTFGLNSSGYYKNYFAKNLRRFDNYNLDLKPSFQYNFKKSDHLRFESVLATNKMTRALTLDEEAIIPLSYFRVNPSVKYQRLFFGKVSTQFQLGYDYRKYKPSTNQLDFTNGEFNAGLGMKYRHKVKKAMVLYKLNYSFANRSYTNWRSAPVQQEGEEQDTDTMQNQWIYHRIGLSMSTKFNEHFIAGLSVNSTHKIDAAGASFGFRENGLALDLAYRKKAFSLAFRTGISRRNYDTRRTFVESGQGDLLLYNYFNSRFRVEYKLTSSLSLNVNMLMRVRKSNSTLNTRFTRRNYNYFSTMAGIAYTFEGKKKKKESDSNRESIRPKKK